MGIQQEYKVVVGNLKTTGLPLGNRKTTRLPMGISLKLIDGVCFSKVKDTKIVLDEAKLGSLFNVPTSGVDVYFQYKPSFPFSHITQDGLVCTFGGSKGSNTLDHNLLNPFHKFFYNLVKKSVIPKQAKRKEVSLLDLAYMHCLETHTQINFLSWMIQYLDHCISNNTDVGYGSCLTEIITNARVLMTGFFSQWVSHGNISNARSIKYLGLCLVDEILEKKVGVGEIRKKKRNKVV